MNGPPLKKKVILKVLRWWWWWCVPFTVFNVHHQVLYSSSHTYQLSNKTVKNQRTRQIDANGRLIAIIIVLNHLYFQGNRLASKHNSLCWLLYCEYIACKSQQRFPVSNKDRQPNVNDRESTQPEEIALCSFGHEYLTRMSESSKIGSQTHRSF